MSMVNHTIASILAGLRDGRVDDAWEICRNALRSETSTPARIRLELYYGFCGMRKLQSMAVDTISRRSLVLVYEDVIDALKSAYSMSLEDDGEAAVEAAILLGALSLSLRNHVPNTGMHTDGSMEQKLTSVIRDLLEWSGKNVGDDGPLPRNERRHDRESNPLAMAYRCAQAFHSMAYERAARLDDQKPRRSDNGGVRKKHGPSGAAPNASHRWLWAVSMVMADFAADFNGSVEPFSHDPAQHLEKALKYSAGIGAHPIGEGLWAAQRAGVSLDPIGCTLLALGRLHLVRGHADDETFRDAALRYEDAYRRFIEVNDVSGLIAVLAARTDLCVRLAEVADGAERERHCDDAALHMEQVRELLAELPPVPMPSPAASPEMRATDYARELETERNEIALFLSVGRIEEIRSTSNYDAALTNYLQAYDAPGPGADPRELLEPLLRIGLVYCRQGDLFNAETALRQGLGIACDLHYRRYIWQFQNALARMYEMRGDFPEALRHIRMASDERAAFQQEQMREAIARHLVKMEMERTELLHQQAVERAGYLEELNRQIQIQNRELATQLGERAQLITKMAQTLRQVLNDLDVDNEVISRAMEVFKVFADDTSGWNEYEQEAESNIPDFLNELNERVPNLTEMQRRISILMRNGASTEDICTLNNGGQSMSEEQMSGYKRTLDTHRRNILAKLDPSGAKKKGKQLRMHLSKWLRFFGNESGDIEFMTRIGKRWPDISPADRLLCRHLRRGFSDQQIAEFYGVTEGVLEERYSRLAAAFGIHASEIRDFLKTV